MMRTLHLDIETYCELDLAEVGVRKYVEHPSFEILLIGYAYDDGPVKQIDLALDDVAENPDINRLTDDLSDPGIMKMAHNAAFERLCFSKRYYGGRTLDPSQWRCTMVRAYQLGLPGSLDKAGLWLGIPDDKKKMAIGKKLIAKFCKPQKDGKRIYPQAALPGTKGDWETFKDYNRQDVEAERSVGDAESKYPECPAHEWEIYCADQDINDRGVGVDLAMAKTINGYVEEHSEKLIGEARAASGLENPQSMPRAKDWLRSKGVRFDNLAKASLDSLIAEAGDPSVRAYLKARKELGKTSLTKYEAMERAAVWHPEDKCYRLHGTLQFDGAIRTGRWAGRIVQTQNLPRNTLPLIEAARDHASKGEFDWLELEYGHPMDTLSQLIRTAFVPKPGCRFVVADYCQIECRVAAWMAGEEYKLEIFRKGGDIYKETASRIYRKPVEKITHEERAKGKVAELAGAYGGGIGAYKRFGADRMGLSDEEIQVLVDLWRDNNPGIVRFWKEAETAVKAAITHPGAEYRIGSKGVSAKMFRDTLFMRLPSRRLIAYKGIRISNTDQGDRIEYLDMKEGMNAFQYVETYGGKLFENIIQSTARDCLAEALWILNGGGWGTVFHVHDECINEVPAETADRDEKSIVEIMKLQGLEWAEGLPLDADSYICDFYKKDD
jgi:DNA polymerase